MKLAKSKDRLRQSQTGGYHLVWPRDLYMMATWFRARRIFWSVMVTGERGHYELARASDMKLSPLQTNAAVNPYVGAIEKFATDSLMIPEQVWDFGPRAGEPTGLATPLGWAHGEYLKLLRSKKDRVVFDELPVVKKRTENAAARTRHVRVRR